jgi:hypothetical protein
MGIINDLFAPSLSSQIHGYHLIDKYRRFVMNPDEIMHLLLIHQNRGSTQEQFRAFLLQAHFVMVRVIVKSGVWKDFLGRIFQDTHFTVDICRFEDIEFLKPQTKDLTDDSTQEGVDFAR